VHASRVLLLASRQNELLRRDRAKVSIRVSRSSRQRDAVAHTRDACATQNPLAARNEAR